MQLRGTQKNAVARIAVRGEHDARGGGERGGTQRGIAGDWGFGRGGGGDRCGCGGGG